MLVQSIPHSVFSPAPPPLWYVTNGDLTVGPVITSLLMRGVESGRVPEFCQVRAGVGSWRELSGVREIAAMKKVSSAPGPSLEEMFEWGLTGERLKRDEMELSHTVTFLSLVATGAESAMFHFRSRFGRAFITRAVVGPMSTERLGYPLPEDDLLLKAARSGRPVMGPPYGPTEDALAMRFASSRGGAGAVAMIPIFVRGMLTALLEVSRPGHAFRRTDLQKAERVVKRALIQRAS